MNFFAHTTYGKKRINKYWSKATLDKESSLLHLRDFIEGLKKNLEESDLDSIQFEFSFQPPHIDISRTSILEIRGAELSTPEYKRIDRCKIKNYLDMFDENDSYHSTYYVLDKATPEGLLRIWVNDLLWDFNHGKLDKNIQPIEVFRTAEWIARTYFKKSLFLEED